MSTHGIHAHGPHDHEVEHQAQHGPGLAQSIAIFTALLPRSEPSSAITWLPH